MNKFILFIFALIAVSHAGDAAITDLEEDTNPEAVIPDPEPSTGSAAGGARGARRRAAAAADEERDEPAPAQEEAAEAVESAARNATEPRWDRKVMELDADSFEAQVNRFEALMVEFYAPWCGHCQEFDPVYQEAAQMLYDGNPRYFLAKIDGSRYPEIKERYEVPGFPTLLFFKAGAPMAYTGERRARAIAKWVRKEGPDRVAAVSCAQLQELKQREAHVMVYFGQRKTDSKYLALAALAGLERRFAFYFVREPACAAKHGVEMKSVAFLTNFEGEGARVFKWPGGADAAAMAAWYEPEMIPPLSEFEEDIGRSMRRSQLPAVILFRPEDDEFEDYAFVYKRAAVANRGKAIFVWSTDGGDGAELAAHMRVTGGYRDETAPTYPSIRVVWIYRQARYLSYIAPKDHSVASITELVDGVLAGTAKLFLPSANRPDRSLPAPPGAVWLVVGHTHAEDTSSDTVDLLLFWHAPGCPHCQKYHPEFAALAYRLRAYPLLRFGSIDAKANAVAGADVERWPLLRFHARGGAAGAAGVPVAGDERAEPAVLQWLLDHSPALKDAGLTSIADLDAANVILEAEEAKVAAEKAAAAGEQAPGSTDAKPIEGDAAAKDAPAEEKAEVKSEL